MISTNDDEIETVAVVGAGEMGRGIAAVAALAGYETSICDVDSNQLEAAREHIEWSLGKSVERNAIDRSSADAALDRTETTTSLPEAVAKADFVTEATVEQQEVKESVFDDLDAHAPERTILATNTSGLNITRLAEATDRPERVIGTHWFNPPMLMDLVEIIETEHTDDAVVNTVEALVEALRRLEDGSDASEYKATLSEYIQRWLASEQRKRNGALLPSVEGEVANLLQETDSSHVLPITDSISSNLPFLLARFRNGDVNAGLRYCDIHPDAPNVNNPRRDRVFEAATHRWGDQYSEALSDALAEIDEEHVHAALQLAGFLGRPELGVGLEDCWEEHGDEPELLPAFLWATFQCCIPDRTALVDQVLSRWTSLPSGSRLEDALDDDIRREGVYRKVKFSLTRDLSEEQIQYLLETVETFPDIEYQLLLLLKSVPDPDVIELIVTKLGERDRESDGPSPFSGFFDQWRPEHPRGRALPPEAKGRLYEIWTSASIIDEVRSKAFQLWSWSTDEDDVDELRRASDDDLFAHAATRRRLELGDEAVFRSPPLDFTENSYLLRNVPSAWCLEAYEFVDEILDHESPGEQNELFYNTGELLFRIPQSDAEQLLEDHWETVGDQPVFFQAALYTATPRTKDLAESTYEASETPAALFELMRSHFGFNRRGQSELISEEQLFALEPYLAELDDLTLVDIAEKAKTLGLTEWGETYVRPQLSEEERPRSYPTDEELLDQLDALEDRDKPHRALSDIRSWLKGFDRRAEPTSRAFRLLDEWLTEETSAAGYRLVAHAVKIRGTRDDLSILQGVSLDEEREYHYDDAAFGVRVRTLS